MIISKQILNSVTSSIKFLLFNSTDIKRELDKWPFVIEGSSLQPRLAGPCLIVYHFSLSLGRLINWSLITIDVTFLVNDTSNKLLMAPKITKVCYNRTILLLKAYNNQLLLGLC